MFQGANSLGCLQLLLWIHAFTRVLRSRALMVQCRLASIPEQWERTRYCIVNGVLVYTAADKSISMTMAFGFYHNHHKNYIEN